MRKKEIKRNVKRKKEIKRNVKRKKEKNEIHKDHVV